MDQKDDWCVDLEFISQFESLLIRLDWERAELNHTYTGTKVVWERNKSNDHSDMPRNDFVRKAYGSMHDLKEIDIQG